MKIFRLDFNEGSDKTPAFIEVKAEQRCMNFATAITLHASTEPSTLMTVLQSLQPPDNALCCNNDCSSAASANTMANNIQTDAQQSEPLQVAVTAVPSKVQEAQRLLQSSHFGNNEYKKALRVLHISGAVNAKVRTKERLIAMKMVQRSISVENIRQCIDGTISSEHPSYQILTALPHTTVRIIRSENGNEEVEFVRGDAPKIANDEVLVGEPSFESNQNSSCLSDRRRPPFEAGEYCRLLHVLCDSRMTATRTSLMVCMSREELDREHTDPWCERIAPMYNDLNFRPQANRVLCGGVTISDISMIDPALRPHEREGGVLKRKFGEFKSMYGQCVSRFEASGQGDPDAFASFADGRAHIMYGYCLLQLHPILKPLVTRALGAGIEREEGVGAGVNPYGFGGNEVLSSRRKRPRRDVQDVNVVGIDRIASALKSQQQSFPADIEDLERKRLQFEMLDAQARATSSALEAIGRLKELMDKAESEEDRSLFEGILKKLKASLASGTNV